MASHGSVTAHKQKPHVIPTTSNALRRSAQTSLSDKSIDPDSRAIIRYGSNDHASSEYDSKDGSTEEKLATLIETICGASEESAAAVLVLIGMFQNSVYPQVLANTAKHIAFTRCGELNLYGMVDAQIAALERELWAG